MKKILMLVNNPAFFLSHRLPIALKAQEDGFDVHVATMDGDSVKKIQALGFTHHVLPLNRSGTNPLVELASVWGMYRLFKAVKPDLVHLVTIKPVLYGGIAARLARVPALVSAISGLGFIFTREKKGLDLIKAVTRVLYTFALGHKNCKVIFQNGDDRDTLLSIGAVKTSQVEMIRGSGVDLTEFKATNEPDKPVVAILIARLLKDKGVFEFVQAAQMSALNKDNICWRLVGKPDPGNPASVSEDQINDWTGVIDYLGERHDIADLYANAHIAVLPSYREGLPRSLIEAAACARAVVTTDVPGCRDAIEANETGVLVPVKNAEALYEAVKDLSLNDEKRQKMGAEGRLLAERAFDIKEVVARHLAIYKALL